MVFVVIAQRSFVDNFLRHLERKLRAFAVFAGDFELAAHHRQKFLDNGNAEPRAFDVAIFFFVEANERLEKFLNVFGLYADARIRNFYAQFKRVRVEFCAVDFQSDGALVRVLHGVG